MKEHTGKMRQYIRSVARKLNIPKDVKKRVMNDFISSIEGRLEAGQSEEAIFAELGSAKKAAAELNEQMKEYAYVKSPWRWVFLVLIVFCCMALIFGTLIGILSLLLSIHQEAFSLGIIGGADGPTAIFVTSSPDSFIFNLLPYLLLLAVGVLGFYKLSRCRRK